MQKKLTLVNVGQDTTLGDCDVTKKLVQLLVISDGELKMTGDDTGLLVVASSVASQLEDFSSQVLKDGSKVHWGTGTDTLSVVALAEQTVDTADGESETSLGGAAILKSD
jgi:citrate lyase alpha subunit